MAYATATQIASEAKLSGAFSASTNPTDTKVAEIIAEVEADIDSVISTRYVVPLSNASDILIARGISVVLCAERVREIMGFTVSANIEQQNITTLADKARTKLQAIVEGRMKLNATEVSSTAGVRSYTRENGVTPVFDRSIKQW